MKSMEKPHSRVEWKIGLKVITKATVHKIISRDIKVTSEAMDQEEVNGMMNVEITTEGMGGIKETIVLP